MFSSNLNSSVLFLGVRFILRGLLQYPIRSALTLVGIVLGTAMVVSMLIASESAKSHFDTSLDQLSGQSQLKIISTARQGVDEQWLNKLTWLWQEGARYTPLSQKTVLVESPNHQLQTLNILGVNLLGDQSFRDFSYSSTTEAMPFSKIFSPNVVLISERFANANGLKKGSVLKIINDDQSQLLTVGGVMGEGQLANAYGGFVGVMDMGAYQSTFKTVGHVDEVDIATESKDEALIKSLETRLKKFLPASLNVVHPQFKNQQIHQLMSAYHANLTALSFISFLVSLFLIYNTLAISVARRQSEIGILRLLGVSSTQVFQLFLLESFVFGVCGIALGVVFAIPLSTLLIQATSLTVQNLYTGIPVTQIYINPLMLLVVAVVLLLALLLACLPPIIQASQISPEAASRREAVEIQLRGQYRFWPLASIIFALGALGCLSIPKLQGVPIGGYLASLMVVLALTSILPMLIRPLFAFVMQLTRYCSRPFFTLSVRYAVRLLQAHFGKTLIAIASLMVGLSLMVSIAVMIESFRTSVSMWVNQTLKADLWIQPETKQVTRFYGQLGDDVYVWLKQQPGIEAIDRFVERQVTYKGMPTYLGAGTPSVIAKHGGIKLIDNTPVAPILDEMSHTPTTIVSESFANKFNQHVGETIQLETPSGKTLNLKIAGIYWDYSSENGYVIISRDLYREYYLDNSITNVAVYLKPNVNADGLKAELLRHLGGGRRVEVQTNKELKTHVITIFNATFSITYALHVISAVVAALTVINTLFALLMTAKRDFLLLRTLGMSLKQSAQIIMLIAFILSFLGACFGIVLGLIQALILINVIQLQSFGWHIMLNIPKLFLLQTIAVTTLVGLIAATLPIKFSKKLLATETLRYE